MLVAMTGSIERLSINDRRCRNFVNLASRCGSEFRTSTLLGPGRQADCGGLEVDRAKAG
jgi:hypothetical protein